MVQMVGMVGKVIGKGREEKRRKVHSPLIYLCFSNL